MPSFLHPQIVENELMARVLVVDDAPAIRLLMDRVLSRAGFGVVTAGSGREALALLAAGELPDIVLLDVEMAHGGGWETLSRVRGDPRTARLPVVMCTAEGRQEDILLGWSLGCDGYLVKPLDIAAVVPELERILSCDRPGPGDGP